jgi:cyclopropane-fatty-acyl-phospholipid synthase
MSVGMAFAERRWLPDRLIRLGIRRLDRMRLREISPASAKAARAAKQRFIEVIRQSPIAIETNKANEQHYELPPEFFELVLGRHLKYSSAFWSDETATLDQAEELMLEMTCQRAELSDGQAILELGCGWGSLSLWMARHYPRSQIVAVSNSRPQKKFIDARIAQQGIDNLRILTSDMNAFDPGARFDRVVSVEMIEHMRNWPHLLQRIAGWLTPGGKLFLHYFAHKEAAYTFETEGDDDWMGRYFFTGGMMPSEDLLYYLQDHLEIESHWRVNGVHYQKTADAWLANLDANRRQILPVMQNVYGQRNAQRWLQRWRIFFMACSELWGYKAGEEWVVSHYRLKKRDHVV